MSPTKPVGEKPPDPNGRGGNTGAQVVFPAPNQDVRVPGGPPGDDGAPAVGNTAVGLEKTQGAKSAAPSYAAGLGNNGLASATPSYANMLKTNIRFDQRLKRNVLEVHIHIEKSFIVY